jgi:hypothetical protein
MGLKNYSEQALNGIIKVETKEFVKNKAMQKLTTKKRKSCRFYGSLKKLL